MQSDVFDKKIQEAAAHHHPVYDEQAWDKMQLKLDKHLPVEKKDRRRFLWLWIFLLFLAAGGSYFIMSKSSGNKNSMAINDQPAQLPATAEKAGEANNTENNNGATPGNALPSSANSNKATTNSTTLPEPTSKTVSSKENKDNSPSILSNKEDQKGDNTSGFKIDKAVTAKPAARKDLVPGNAISNTASTASTQSTSKRKSKRSADAVKYSNDDYSLQMTGSKKKKNRSNKERDNSSDEIATNPKTNTENIKDQPDPSPIAADNDEKSMTVSLTGDEKKAEEPVIVNEKEKTDAVADNKTNTNTAAENKDVVTKAETAQVKIPASKKKNKFGNNFAFTISAGPDVSAIQLSNVGKTEFEIGVGLSYSFAKRWNVRSGFFVVDKVYSARPQDYNPPPQFWNYYPYLEDIYANCRVFEIPLIVSYTIKQNVNHAWFASAGLSSLSMNRERYDYVSKTSAGGYETRRYTIHNINSHFFSALRLSAGYYKQINKGTFFVVEPYISAPLKGVGLGKVKLSGAGVLFTLGIKPFQKK